MKPSKQFDFRLPLTATRYGSVQCIGNLEISGVAYSKEGEITYDIDELHFVDANERRTKVEIEVAQWLAGGELPDDIHAATQSHCEGVFEAADKTTDLKQDEGVFSMLGLPDVFKDFGQIFNPNTNAA